MSPERKTPNYRVYHLHELGSALEKLDRESYPEEAKVIEEYIQKGGYKYPDLPKPLALNDIAPKADPGTVMISKVLASALILLIAIVYFIAGGDAENSFGIMIVLAIIYGIYFPMFELAHDLNDEVDEEIRLEKESRKHENLEWEVNSLSESAEPD